MPNTTFKSKVRVGDGITLKDRATVTQATSATTGVTINANAGSITTVAQNIAAAGEVQFTVTNSKVAAGAVPLVAVASGSAGSATTVASVTAVAAGSFQITLTNLHASNAETGTLVINFVVLNQELATAI